VSARDDFDQFYLATHNRLVGQVAAILGNLGEAEEAVQEAFARASQRWDRLQRHDLPEAWVRRVAIREAVHGRRRQHRRHLLMLRLGPPPPVPEPGTTSAGAIDVDRAMRRLPLRHREVLVLHYVVGLGVEEIAAQLQVPAGTVKSRLSRARTAIAGYLGDQVPDNQPGVIDRA
jgi:RNA polymerase sigma-70 factor, ECF subfamily